MTKSTQTPEGLTEYRITFGWGQEHEGSYTTVFAPNHTEAANIMTARYGLKWSHQYLPDQWAKWGREMIGYTELEVLSFDEGVCMPLYPDQSTCIEEVVYGMECR